MNRQFPDTAQRILETAERLAQTKGFNGFSYADIAQELNMTKPSLHYHFASKADLGRALIIRYSEAFNAALKHIEAHSQQPLDSYVHLYEDVLIRNRMCLCGMLAAEYATLPASMQAELRRFFDQNETWLAHQLERARAHGSAHFDGAALDAARALTAGLEGAMLLARSYEEPARFTATARRLLAQLRVGSSTVTRVRRRGGAQQRARR